MPYTNDMATLADVVSPVDAAMQAGQQSGNEDIQDAIKTQIQQATIPQEIQKASLANALTQAQAYNEQGIGMQNTAKGIQDINATPSATQAAIAGNQGKITSAHVDQLQQLSQVVGSLDQQLQQYPDAAKPAVVSQFLDSNGVQDPSIRQLMMNAASQPGGLTQIANGLYSASEKARSSVLEGNIRGQYEENVAQIGATGREAVAEANAQARVNVANINAQIRQQQQTFEQAAVAAQKRGDMATYAQMSQLAMQMRQAQAQLNSQLLFGQNLPNPAVSSENPPQRGGGTTPNPTQQQPQQPTAANADAAVQLAQQQGIDTTKFNVRIGPNGQLQTQPK